MPMMSNSCTQAEFNQNMETLMRDYKTTGKIGNTTPKDSADAQRIASAICYDIQSKCRAKRRKA